jgi:lysophospholipase L1-like esterase
MASSFRAVSILVGSLALAAIFAWSVTTIAVNSGTLAKPRPVLLLTGDSLTEQGTDPTKSGWVTLLQSRYTRTSDVITRGLSGYNTKWFLKDALPLIATEIQTDAYNSPSLITVWLGTNDAALWNGSDSVAHVPIQDYKANLIKIVRGLWVTAPTAKMLLVTPPPVDDAARAEYANASTGGLLDRSNAVTTTYARACVETAGVLGVPVLDLNSFLNAMDETTRNTLLENGLHFNAEGNTVVDEQIRSKIAAEFPALDEALQSWQLPAASKWESEDPWAAVDS